MPETVRPAWSRGLTFLRFVARQRRRLGAIRAGLSAPDASAPLLVDGSETAWKGAGLTVRRGQRFRLTAGGFQWIARPLGLAIEPQNSLWMRIAAGPIHRSQASPAGTGGVSMGRSDHLLLQYSWPQG